MREAGTTARFRQDPLVLVRPTSMGTGAAGQLVPPSPRASYAGFRETPSIFPMVEPSGIGVGSRVKYLPPWPPCPAAIIHQPFRNTAVPEPFWNFGPVCFQASRPEQVLPSQTMVRPSPFSSANLSLLVVVALSWCHPACTKKPLPVPGVVWENKGRVLTPGWQRPPGESRRGRSVWCRKR